MNKSNNTIINTENYLDRQSVSGSFTKSNAEDRLSHRGETKIIGQVKTNKYHTGLKYIKTSKIIERSRSGKKCKKY